MDPYLHQVKMDTQKLTNASNNAKVPVPTLKVESNPDLSRLGSESLNFLSSVWIFWLQFREFSWHGVDPALALISVYITAEGIGDVKLSERVEFG